LTPITSSTNAATRRDFLAGAAATAATLVATTPHVHAGGSDVLRVGLIGCGSRGTGAAEQALRADKNTRLVAMGDMFADKLQKSLSQLKGTPAIAERIDVKPDTSFTGFGAYKSVIEMSDVVLLTTPPHFRPMHLKAAVEAGKHIFCEKPVAVDAPGVRSVIGTCREAEKKKLSLVSGLCWRYHHGKRETMKRVLEPSKKSERRLEGVGRRFAVLGGQAHPDRTTRAQRMAPVLENRAVVENRNHSSPFVDGRSSFKRWSVEQA